MLFTAVYEHVLKGGLDSSIALDCVVFCSDVNGQFYWCEWWDGRLLLLMC